MASPRYKIIEPKNPREPEWRREISPRGRSSSAQRHPVLFPIRILRRPSESGSRQTSQERRGRDRSPRPFVVDFPEDVERSSRSKQRQVSPQIRRVSPQTRTQSNPADRGRMDDSDYPSRRARSQQPSTERRSFRERTPVAEREPEVRRQRQSSGRVVEIHYDQATAKDGEYKSAGRRVRFSSDVEFEENINSTRARERSGLNRRVDGRARDPEERSSHVRVHSPYPGNSRNRPHIIQAGTHEISTAGERILAESRERYQYGNPPRDFELRTHRRRVPEGRSGGRFRMSRSRERSKEDWRRSERWH